MNLQRFVATGGGVGLSPIAPGTMGTLLGFPLAFGLARLLSIEWAWAAMVALFLVGGFAADRESQAMGVADPSSIVVDEYLAFAGLLLCLPVHWGLWVWAFLWFRFFDVLKPFPVSWLDRNVHGGLGIMLDDVAATALAWCALVLMQKGGLV